MLGVRAAIATMAPQLAAPWLGLAAATWASMGGFAVSLVDKGGAYRTRAVTTASCAVFASLAVLVGSLAAGTMPLEVGVVVVGCFAGMLAGALGPPATSVGTTSAVYLAVAVALPAGSAAEAVGRGLWFAAGGGLAMVIALAVWPIRVYAPARRSVAAVYGMLAEHAREMAARGDAGSEAWRAALTARHRPVRDALEVARATMAAVRRGRRGESGRGVRLLVLAQLADRMLGTFVALEDALHAAADAPVAQLDDLAGTLGRVAEAVLDEGAVSVGEPAMSEAAESEVAGLLARLRDEAATAVRTVNALESDAIEPETVGEVAVPSTPVVVTLRSALDVHAVIFRHAVRVAVVAGIAVVLGTELSIQRGYWVTLTAMLLLQPYLPATLTKGLQRVGGTVLGGVVAAVIAAEVHEPLVMLVVVGVLAAASAAVLQLNYGLYALFLTPTFVLLSEVHATEPGLVELRIANTLVGGALAVAGSLLLWPTRERARISAQLAAAMDSVRAYAAVGLRAHAASELAAARRGVGLAFNNADLSFQRVLAEGGLGTERMEACMTMLLYGRRVGAAITAAAAASVPVAAEPRIEAVLADLADALRTGRAPAALPVLEGPSRVVEQLTTLHAAAVRYRGVRNPMSMRVPRVRA